MANLKNIISDRQLASHTLAIRKAVVEMVARHGQGYVQQGLGASDLFSYLFFRELRLDSADPNWPDRDRFFLSTAHNTAVFYATLAERGLIDSSELDTYCEDGSPYEINASERIGKTEGSVIGESLVECTCGSLGQGLSVAAGLALGLRREQRPSRVYLMLGDGELQEGQVWEAAMFAATMQLSNLTMIIDLNYMQVEGDARKVAAIDPVDEKLRSFGWHVSSIDGHDMTAIQHSLDEAKQQHKPSAVLALTTPGKGVPFLEGQKSHNMVLPAAAAAKALEHLDSLSASIESHGTIS